MTRTAKNSRQKRNFQLASVEWAGLAVVFALSFALSATTTTVIQQRDTSGLVGGYAVTGTDIEERRALLAGELGIAIPTPAVAAAR